MVATHIPFPSVNASSDSPRIDAFGVTDAGLHRGSNEDAFGLDDNLGVFVVCDGMGGHAAGEVASHLAVGAVMDEFVKRHNVTPMAANACDTAPSVVQQSAMRSAMRRANNSIAAAQADRSDARAMGTTVCAIKVAQEEVVVAHVGDSRVYRWRPEVGLKRLTRDHSLFNRMLDDGMLPSSSLEHEFGQRNVIMRALGTQDHRAEVSIVERQAGDVFVLCSDGLTDMVDDLMLAQIVSFYDGDPRATATALVLAANDNGGHDNITALVVRLKAVSELDASDSYVGGHEDAYLIARRNALQDEVDDQSDDDDECDDGQLQWMSVDEAIAAAQ